MELSEVASAHFALPVVGVVVCAVLVFAFGFKSPVQPPSFDLLNEDDDKKYKKSRQKKHKNSLDGHVICIDGHGSPGARSVAKQQMTTNKQVTNEKYDLQITKMKTKKAKQDFDPANERNSEEQDVEATGEWTMAVSKKDRKNRSKKDDCVKSDDLASLAHEIPKTANVVSSNEAVLNCQESSHKVEEVTLTRTFRRNIEVTVTAPAPIPSPEHLSCYVSSAESDSPSVNVGDFINTAKTTIVRVSVTTGSTTPVTQSIVVKSSGTRTRKSETVSAEADVVPLPGDVDDVKASVVRSVKTSLADSQTVVELTPICSSSRVNGEGKSAPSPKTKKKKSPESREKYKESPVVTIPGDGKSSALSVHDQPKVTVKPGKPNIKPEDIRSDRKVAAVDLEAACHVVPMQTSSAPSDDRIARACSATGNADNPSVVNDASLKVTDSTCDSQGSDVGRSTSDIVSPDESQISVNADELGDWQPAKPLKKKRRPQKESCD